VVEPRLDKSPDRVSLDSAPPSPPAKRAKTMMDTQGDEGGLGEMGGSPQAQALQGLKMAQQGVQQLSLVLPNLGPQLSQFLDQLQQVTVSAVAGMTTGGAPGVAPMAPPPPPAVMGNAPPPAVPGMAGGM